MKKHVLFFAVVITYVAAAMGQSPDFSPNHDMVLCGPNDVFFVCVTPESPDNIWWDFGDGTTGVGINPSHRYTVAGSFDVKMIVEVNGTKDSVVKYGFVTILPHPEASFTVEKTPLLEPFKRIFVFNGFSNADSITRYTWKINDTIVSDQPIFSYQFKGNDHYAVSLEITNNKGCSDYVLIPVTIFDEPVVATAIVEPIGKQVYAMGYNIEGAMLTVHRQTNSNLIASVILYDIAGNLVRQASLSSDQQSLLINMQMLPKGIYIVSVADSEYSVVKRLAKPI